jgi:hypothetical protein
MRDTEWRDTARHGFPDTGCDARKRQLRMLGRQASAGHIDITTTCETRQREAPQPLALVGMKTRGLTGGEEAGWVLRGAGKRARLLESHVVKAVYLERGLHER